MNVTTRPLSAALAVVALSAVLGACGAGAEPQTSTTSPAAAVATAAPAPKVGDKVDGAALSARVAAAMKRSGGVKVAVQGEGFNLSGDVLTDGAESDIRLSVSGGDDPDMELVLVDDTLFMKSTDLNKAGRYVRFGDDVEDPMVGMLGGIMRIFTELVDPVNSVEALAKGPVTVVAVDGGDITYEFVSSDAKDEGAASPSPSPSASASTSAKGTTMRVTLDENSLLTHVATTEDDGSAVTYSQWGQTSPIQAPVGDQLGAAETE